MNAKKLVRSIQVFLPFLVGAKIAAQSFARKVLRVPHDADFRGLALLPPSPAGLVYIDIGANRGQSIDSIRLVCGDVPIVAFEPNRVLNNGLVNKYQSSRVTIHDVALGRQPGAFTLHIPFYRGYGFDSLASLNHANAATWLNHDTLYLFSQKHLSISSQEVQCRTLDSFELKPHFIKIDVEGSELDVVLGGLETIRRYHPTLLVETSQANSQLWSLMDSLGYRPFSFSGTAFSDYRPGSLNVFFIFPLASQ